MSDGPFFTARDQIGYSRLYILQMATNILLIRCDSNHMLQAVLGGNEFATLYVHHAQIV